MTKPILYTLAVIVVLGVVGAWYAKQLHDAELRGIDKQVAAEIAKSNQLIAERRVLDAQFDKMDAAAVCRDVGLTWVYVDNRSHCE
jgi:hypothetical protein